MAAVHAWLLDDVSCGGLLGRPREDCLVGTFISSIVDLASAAAGLALAAPIAHFTVTVPAEGIVQRLREYVVFPSAMARRTEAVALEEAAAGAIAIFTVLLRHRSLLILGTY